MYPIFVQKAEELRDRWDEIIDPSCSSFSQGIILDVYNWMNRAALDVIGLAGFGYSFDSLTDRSEEVSTAFRGMTEAAEKPLGFKEMFALWFPIIEDILVGGLQKRRIICRVTDCHTCVP